MLPFLSRKRRKVVARVDAQETTNNDVKRTAPTWRPDILNRNQYQSHVGYQGIHIIEDSDGKRKPDIYSPKGTRTPHDSSTCSTSSSSLAPASTAAPIAPAERTVFGEITQHSFSPSVAALEFSKSMEFTSLTTNATKNISLGESRRVLPLPRALNTETNREGGFRSKGMNVNNDSDIKNREKNIGERRANTESRVVPNKKLRERIKRRQKGGLEKMRGTVEQTESGSESGTSSYVKDNGSRGQKVFTASRFLSRESPMDFEYTAQRPVWAHSANQSLVFNRSREAPLQGLEFTNRSNTIPAWRLDARQVQSQPSSGQIETQASKVSTEKTNFLLRCLKLSSTPLLLLGSVYMLVQLFVFIADYETNVISSSESTLAIRVTPII